MKTKTYIMLDSMGKKIKINSEDIFGLAHEIYIVATTGNQKDGILFFSYEIMRVIEDFLDEKTGRSINNQSVKPD